MQPKRFTYDYVLRLLIGGGMRFEQAHRIASTYPAEPVGERGT